MPRGIASAAGPCAVLLALFAAASAYASIEGGDTALLGRSGLQSRIDVGAGALRRLARDGGGSGAAAHIVNEDEALAALRQRSLLQDGGGDMAMPTGIAAWNPRVHGYTASISLGLVMPLAAVIARSFREYPPWWFWIHMPLGVAAFIGGIIGVVFGAKQTSDPGSLYSAHKAVGGIALGLAGLQVAASLLRPRLDHPKRFMWNIFHHWTGRLAIAAAITNVYVGLHLSMEEYKFWWGYAIVLGAIILLWLAKEVIDLFRVLAANRRVGSDGRPLTGTGLPGGYPMNGNFAPTFLQRRPPADSGLPIAGHGIESQTGKLAPTNEVATGAFANGGGAGVNGGASNVNGGDRTGMLHQPAPHASGRRIMLGDRTGSLHLVYQHDDPRPSVEMARRASGQMAQV